MASIWETLSTMFLNSLLLIVFAKIETLYRNELMFCAVLLLLGILFSTTTYFSTYCNIFPIRHLTIPHTFTVSRFLRKGTLSPVHLHRKHRGCRARWMTYDLFVLPTQAMMNIYIYYASTLPLSPYTVFSIIKVLTRLSRTL